MQNAQNPTGELSFVEAQPEHIESIHIVHQSSAKIRSSQTNHGEKSKQNLLEWKDTWNTCPRSLVTYGHIGATRSGKASHRSGLYDAHLTHRVAGIDPDEIGEGMERNAR